MSAGTLRPAEQLRAAIRIVGNVIDAQKRIPGWEDDSQFMKGVLPPRQVVAQLREAQQHLVDALAMVNGVDTDCGR